MTNSQNILLVDDRPENILVLESILEMPGRTFISAYSGEEALMKLLKYDISLILLDVQMPGIDGFETAKLMRKSLRTRSIPIIFVTAISKEQKHIFKGYESGAVDYLFKPVEPEIVRGKVNIFLELDRQRKLLEINNRALNAAKQNTDNILKNVEEGLFLIEQNFGIKPGYSAALCKIFDMQDLSGANLLQILQKNLATDAYGSAADFLDLMFRPDLAEVDFYELNPLIDVRFGEKYLSFKVKRIGEGGRIAALIITVVDRTDQVILRNKLNDTEDMTNRQTDLLHILNTEPLLLKSFLQQTGDDLSRILNYLVSEPDNQTGEELYRIVHSVKGNAGLLEFHYLASKAHEFEEILRSIRPFKTERHVRIAELKELHADMSKTLDTLNDLIIRISEFHKGYNNQLTKAGKLIIKAIEDLVKRLNQELQCNVIFNHSNFDEDAVPAGDFLFYKDIIAQLTRNAMVHGVEPADERKKNKKQTPPTITLSSEIVDNRLIIHFMDNGRGLQIDKIRMAALDRKVLPEEKLRAMNDQEIAELIYTPGLSTSDITGLLAGRGIGMNMIKKRIEEKQGLICLKFETGKYCEFNITAPLAG